MSASVSAAHGRCDELCACKGRRRDGDAGGARVVVGRALAGAHADDERAEIEPDEAAPRWRPSPCSASLERVASIDDWPDTPPNPPLACALAGAPNVGGAPTELRLRIDEATQSARARADGGVEGASSDAAAGNAFTSSTRPTSYWASRPVSPGAGARARASLVRASTAPLDPQVVAATALAHAVVALAAEQPSREARRRLRDEHRRDEEMLRALVEWRTHLSPHFATARTSRRLQHLVRTGVPPAVRPELWKMAIGNALGITREHVAACGTAGAGVDDAEAEAKRARTEAALRRMVEVDMARTLPELSALFTSDGELYGACVFALRSCALLSPHGWWCGYVQGQTFLGAVLSLNCEGDELLAAQMLANLMNRPLLRALYSMEPTARTRSFELHDELLALALPRVRARFCGAGVRAEQYVLDWFLTLFAKVQRPRTRALAVCVLARAVRARHGEGKGGRPRRRGRTRARTLLPASRCLPARSSPPRRSRAWRRRCRSTWPSGCGTSSSSKAMRPSSELPSECSDTTRRFCSTRSSRTTS